ncbi:Juxtaposed with another zinc finger protein 1 [Fukomys damarensis]|uniref:Juxtaposed with another zinc finger protein 1 n=2 Tax=Boreoeutheria TaxID=1437010 RepID=A0A091DMN3_FUKDA|nr:Juxtaposed with another zinc finger protein 1 [Fukomys damarensis]
MTDAARREQESLKKKIQPKLSLTLSSSVSRGNVSTPPRHSSGSLTPPVTPPITPSSSFRSSTPTVCTNLGQPDFQECATQVVSVNDLLWEGDYRCRREAHTLLELKTHLEDVQKDKSRSRDQRELQRHSFVVPEDSAAELDKPPGLLTENILTGSTDCSKPWSKQLTRHALSKWAVGSIAREESGKEKWPSFARMELEAMWSPGDGVCSSNPLGLVPFDPFRSSEYDEEEVDYEESDSDESWTTESAISSEAILSSMCMNGGEEKPFACPVPGCKKRYKNVNGIKYHAKNGHRTQIRVRKPFKCRCGKSYKTAQGLRHHTINFHPPVSAEIIRKMQQ